MTRAKINATLSGTTPAPTSTPTPTPTTPTGPAGSLTVSLAYDTPASGSIPNSANGNFTKVTLTAGSGDVSISKMYVTRKGLSSNSAVENIKVVDAMTGVYSGSIGSLNSDNKALITFTQNVVVKANTSWSFYIKAGFVASTSTAPAGNTASLGIGMASDITSNATSVMGTFPVTGNVMAVVNLTIGTAAVEEDGATVDSKPNVGDVGVTLNNFKVTGSSTEAITVEAITMLKAGTVSNNYLSNLELWDVTNSKSLGVVASLNAEGKASWSNLNIVLGKGNTQRFKIRTTIIDGPGLTANADIVDGSEVLIVVKGNTYGYYITPTATGSWAGTGTSNQTINSGALVVSKSASTPATGNTSAGNDKVMAVFDFDARGESVKISSLKFTATLGTMVYTEVTNIAVYDEMGIIVAGPKDLASGSTVTFTDTFIVPVGVHRYTVKTKIADAVSASDTVKFGVADSSADITAKGMTSNSSITPSPASAVNGNTLTVKAAALIVTTQSSPAGRSVALGTQDFLWATFNLSAVNSGENVQVTAVSVLDTTVTGANPNDLDNMSLWADLTSANSARGDVYETKISNTENPTGNSADDDVAQAFTLNQTITVPMAGFVNVGLVASLNAGALTTGSPTHVLSIGGATATGLVTSNGASTGAAITETYVTTNKQTMTNSGGGALTLTKDSSTPIADLILGNSTVSLGVFRLASSNVENLDVDDITLSVSNGTAVGTFWFYNGSTLLGSVQGGTTPKLVLNDGQLTVPANGNVKVTVKAMLLPVDGSIVTDGTSLTATIQGSAKINTTGLGSGSQITSGVQSAIANTMVIVNGKPTFVAETGTGLSGSLLPSASHLLAIFDVSASGEDDVTFSSSQTNLFKVNISRSSFTSDAAAGNWVLKDEAGDTLSTISVADAATSVTFLFATKDFEVSAGSPKKLYVYGDTHEMTTVGNTIQLSLSDSADANLSYSVDHGTTITSGTKSFRGIIQAGSFDKK
ncbi:MAG: hypothetical protein EXS48_00320 [Candidatus Staskawiczbacteria bacterium]|nr:hypothetical protein [Candidatus Staskawiczbacteria bacterium]